MIKRKKINPDGGNFERYIDDTPYGVVIGGCGNSVTFTKKQILEICRYILCHRKLLNG